MCDTMVTLTDEGVLFAKNSDRDPNEAQVVEWHPGQAHEPGATVRATWISIPQVRRTNAIVISRPWWIWGAEMGANEHGVVIGNEAVFTTERLRGPRGLLGMDLLRLALERADNAEAAVDTIVDLLQTYGQAGPHSFENPRFAYHNSFLIADRTGAFVLETAGRKWAVEQVNGARSISNGLTIPAFAERYSDRLRSRVAQCARRQQLTEQGAAAAKAPADLLAVLRDNGTGGGPRWSPLNGSMVGPNMHAGGLITSSMTASSWVADLSADQHWVTGTCDPALSVFIPIRVGEGAEMGPDPTNRYDPAARWWRHEAFRRIAARDWAGAVSAIAAEREEVEARWLAAPPSTAAALAEAEELYSRWAERIGVVGDDRPLWVRHLWKRWDQQAGIARD